jgi:putative Holliday junction resolvase
MHLHMRLMGFDYGQRRLGIAIGDRLTRHARGLVTLPTHHPQTATRLAALVDEWQPEAFVVGWPTQADGQATRLGPAIRGFAHQLQRQFARPVYWSDEHLSSHAGRERTQRGRRDPGLDAHAAAVILEGWMLEQPQDAPHSPPQEAPA